ncbi:hypothetical protein M3Y99_01935000 [Aphelenchoides fujianensis]|nr:hypothetical protein M3Y99_01935000 [Aphelenchoides fujianensis]
MSVQAESELVAVDWDGFAYGGEAIDVPLRRGNVSYLTTLDEFEDGNREQPDKPIAQLELLVAQPLSPVSLQGGNEELADPFSSQPPVQEIKQELGDPPAPPAPPAILIVNDLPAAAAALPQEVKEEVGDEQVEPPAVARTPAAPPVSSQQVKQETKQETENNEEDPNVPGPSRGRTTTRKRGAEQTEEEEVDEPPIKRERSKSPPAARKKEPADEQPPKSRPTASLRLPPPERQLLSLAVALDKIAGLKQTPTLLYLDVQVMSEESGTLLVDYWKDTPGGRVLVLRVKEVPLPTMYMTKQPNHIVRSTREPTHVLFYCKENTKQLREAIRKEAPDPLSFRQHAEQLIPALQIPCALLVADAFDRNKVDVAALALSNVFIV